MPGDVSRTTIAALERSVLRALCTDVGATREWEGITRSLAGYVWREPEHRVVYEALRRIPSRTTKTRRDQLPAQATRMGFPDVDWANYLDANETPPSRDHLDRLIADLKAAATHKE
jgi:hypothetical protein